jgi:hypothetical protein
MNHTVTSSNELPDIVRIANRHGQGYESLLGRICSRLLEVVQVFNPGGPVNQNHKSYIEENLLNPVVGQEISRTLRR